jgi:hypothetical protein
LNFPRREEILNIKSPKKLEIKLIFKDGSQNRTHRIKSLNAPIIGCKAKVERLNAETTLQVKLGWVGCVWVWGEVNC